ncbi:MAG: NUDIX domain-containing protein [Gammaproteobacteria bacterium]|nr:MAG: NUDIX domain-containing protein [Gammaproteobacteria bacterium]
MNFCSHCGAPVRLSVPEGDNRERHVCDQCDRIHYINPNIVAGTLPYHEGKILLCRRAIEPRKGYWTLPAGFMEMNESTEEAALRETLEEACAEAEVGPLLSMISVPQIGQVHIFYLASLKTGQFAPGEESLEVALFAPDEIPWDDIAFHTVRKTLRFFINQNCEFNGRPLSGVIRIPEDRATKLQSG